MDPHGNIYEDEDEKIPDEDRARLEGYLRGRAEAVRLAERAERLAEAERRAELRERVRKR